MNRMFNFNSVERVRLGRGLARITQVTEQAVEYIDENGTERSIDLLECERMGGALETAGQFPPGADVDWASLADAIRPEQSPQGLRRGGCVGLRGALDNPPWFQFLNRRRTQFEFEDRGALDEDLLRPMARMTFDAC